jgi:predicted ArsR family transcriptional regulator
VTPRDGWAAVPRWVLDDEALSNHAKLLIVVLSSYVSVRTQQCWPSHATLAEKCGVSTDTVQRALRELRARGLVTWEARTRRDTGQTSNLYSLHLMDLVPHTAVGGTA